MSESETPHTAPRGARLAEHGYPHPALRPIMAGLIVFGLAGIAVSVIGLLALAIIYALPLLPLMAFFLATLAMPLLLLSVLHPHITVHEHGLWLKPLVWRGVWVPWEAIARIEDHTLIQRGKSKDRQREHFGQLIVVDAGLPGVYLVVGLMAGLGRVRAFGISTHGHTDYTALRNTIQRRKPHSAAT